MKVYILAGFEEGPFFYFVQEGMRSNHWVAEAAEHLGLSAELTSEFEAWDNSYQDLYNESSPQDSGFPSPEFKEEWVEKGKELAMRLKTESSIVSSVDYQANGSIQEGTIVF